MLFLLCYALPQKLGRALCQVLDLLAAGDSGSDDLDIGPGCFDRRDEPAVGDREKTKAE